MGVSAAAVRVRSRVRLSQSVARHTVMVYGVGDRTYQNVCNVYIESVSSKVPWPFHRRSSYLLTKARVSMI